MLAEVLAAAEPLRGSGRVADYIPALARVDPNKLGIAFADEDGRVHGAGDCDEPFSIQSISKVFTLALALERVGVEPVGQGRARAFGQRVQLDRPARERAGQAAQSADQPRRDGRHRPADRRAAAPTRRSPLCSPCCARQARDDSVACRRGGGARPKRETGARNRSLAWFMKSFGMLANDVETVLGAYFRQCAVAMSCRQLARAGLFLAFDGRDPETRRGGRPPGTGRGGSTA